MDRLRRPLAFAAPRLLVAALLLAAPAEAQDRVAERACGRILERAYGALGAVARQLRLPMGAPFKEEYLGSYTAEAFRARCLTLPAKLRSCLAQKPNPLVAVSSCGGDEQTLRFPRLDRWSPVGQLPRLSAAEAAELQRFAVGSWSGSGGYNRWDVRADGTVRIRSGSLDRIYRMRFRHRGRVELEEGPGRADASPFARGDARTLYAGGNQHYRVYPIAGEETFELATAAYFLFYDRGRCSAVSDTGVPMPVRCTLADDRGTRVFSVEHIGEHIVGDHIGSKDEPDRFRVIPGFLLDWLRVSMTRVEPSK